jgi:flagellar biosynthesis protein FlhG
VHQDRTLVESVRRQTPLMKFAPQATASKDIVGIAKKLVRYREDNRERIAGRPILKDFPTE